jgi:hypothetical protein
MSDPVLLQEPLRPSDRERLDRLEKILTEETERRTSLLKAIKEEEKLWRSVSKTEGMNKMEASAAKVAAVMLNNLVDRWERGERFVWDSAEKTIRNIVDR